MKTEKQLIEKIKKGDKLAFRKVIEHHQQSLFHFVLSLTGEPDDSHDILQEVFLRVWRKIHRFDNNLAFRPWIFRIAHNRCKDYWKHKQRKRNRDNNYIPDETLKYNKVDSLTFQEICSLIGELPDRQKSVYILRDLQEMNIKTVASILNISHAAVKTNLFHARRSLQNKIKLLKTDTNHDM